MTKAYVIEMDDEGASTFHLFTDKTVFDSAKAADDNDTGLMEWFSAEGDLGQAIHDAPSFHSVKDLTKYLKANDLDLKDQIKGYFF